MKQNYFRNVFQESNFHTFVNYLYSKTWTLIVTALLQWALKRQQWQMVIHNCQAKDQILCGKLFGKINKVSYVKLVLIFKKIRLSKEMLGMWEMNKLTGSRQAKVGGRTSAYNVILKIRNTHPTYNLLPKREIYSVYQRDITQVIKSYHIFKNWEM